MSAITEPRDAPRDGLSPSRARACARGLLGPAAARPSRTRKTIVVFAIRTIMQPLLLVFVFTYVFPKIGQGVGGSSHSEAHFSTLLMAGCGATSMIFQGCRRSLCRWCRSSATPVRSKTA